MSDRVGTIDISKGDPAIAFVHGICCLPTDYQWHIDAFSETNRVIAPVFRGDKGEDVASKDLRIEDFATDVVAALEERNLSNVILCGHSLGVRIVLEAQAQAPDRVAGLVLIDGSKSTWDNLEALLKGFDGIEDILSLIHI